MDSVTPLTSKPQSKSGVANGGKHPCLMPDLPDHPSLFQISARVLCHDLSAQLKKSATLGDLPERFFDRLQELGFDIVYLLGVWTTGETSLEEAKKHMRNISPQTPSDEVCSSPFSIRAYEVHPDFGGEEALQLFRERLSRRKIRLVLDFVPNHVALDHSWVEDGSDCLFQGSEELLQQESNNFRKLGNGRIIAHGKDPYFDGWKDTIQLNYASETLRSRQIETLQRICTLCDGVRCDMAMLVCTEVFMRTWGDYYKRAYGKRLDNFKEFWPEAIASVKKNRESVASPGGNSDFLFIAEVYWDMEYHLQQQGFDYCYDKRLMDRLQQRNGNETRMHLKGDLNYQRKLVRFLENHDEDRAAATFGSIAEHRAAAVACYFSPGLRFFYDGQLEGRRFHLEMQRQKRPEEAENPEASGLYISVLDILKRPALRFGEWRSADAKPGGDDCNVVNVIAHFWLPREKSEKHHYSPCPLLILTNFGCWGTACRVRFPCEIFETAPAMRNVVSRGKVRGSGSILLHGLMGLEDYGKSRREAEHEGVWFGLGPWQAQVFEVYNI